MKQQSSGEWNGERSSEKKQNDVFIEIIINNVDDHYKLIDNKERNKNKTKIMKIIMNLLYIFNVEVEWLFQ